MFRVETRLRKTEETEKDWKRIWIHSGVIKAYIGNNLVHKEDIVFTAKQISCKC